MPCEKSWVSVRDGATDLAHLEAEQDRELQSVQAQRTSCIVYPQERYLTR